MATQYASGYRMHEHAHPWRQLLYATSGAMTVYAGRWSWIIPPGKAVFIPAGCRHAMRMWGEVAMRSLYFPADLQAAVLASGECFVLSVTPLLRELILRVVDLPALDSRVAEDQTRSTPSISALIPSRASGVSTSRKAASPSTGTSSAASP